ncbi:unnamed protein product [Durusdinium trenchii]|uniref:Uncharacterized protein n=2 Tax=Durusdinium trenchii TaxID=1381693 RepID=A0ABP0NV07_9DINO
MASGGAMPDEEKKEPVDVGLGMKRASKYIADQMLESRHLKTLHQTLSIAWNRNGQVQSLPAVIALMEQYGVELPPEEVDRISSMDQDQQIAALVNRMPQDSQEQFQQFFLQLQLLVSTAMRVRDGLEDGAVDKVETALDDADSTGVTQEILRMAIVQAGNEAAVQMREYEAWCLQTDEQMGRLIRGQEEAMAAKKKLATLLAGLQSDRDEHAERALKVCINFVNNDQDWTTNACFQGWSFWTKRAREEASITKSYEDRIGRLRSRQEGYRQSSLACLHSLFEKKAKMQEIELQAQVIKGWYHALQERKDNDSLSGQVDAMNSRLASIQGAQKETTKRVVDRMTNNVSMSLLAQAVEGWHGEVQESKKYSEMNKLILQAQRRIHDYLKDKNEASLKVLKMALGGCESNNITQAFACWKSHVLNTKQEAELEEIMKENKKLIQDYKEEHSQAATSAMNRAALFYDENLLLEVFENWRIDCAMEMTIARNEGRIDAKRQQLSSIRQMFRTFAQQMTTSISQSVEEKSELRRPSSEQRSGLWKMENGSVSLPDIHKPHTPPGEPQAEVAPKMAWG